MMSFRRFFGSIAAAALLAGPAQVHAQSSGDPDPLFRLDQFTRRSIETLRDTARLWNLPDRPIVQKALQGKAKNAEPRQIVDVARKLLLDMRTARDALELASEDEIVAGVGALSAGLRPEDLALFRSTQHGRSPLMALTLLTDLIARLGVPRDHAVPAFVSLWKSGLADADLQGLWRRVDQDILSGVNPGVSLQTRAREVPVRIPPEEITL